MSKRIAKKSRKSAPRKANRGRKKARNLAASPKADSAKKLAEEVAPVVEPTAASKPAQLVDLDEEPVADPIAKLEPARGMSLKLHALNVRLPWLKVVALVLLAAVLVVGVEETLRNNASRPVDVRTVDSAPGELPTVADAPEKEPVAEPAPEAQEPETPQAEAPVAKPIENKPVVQQPQGRKLVALTFDDGPSAVQTPRLLQILKEKGVKATFFVLGAMAQRSPGVVRQAEADGHEIASHTMTHANLKKSTVEGIKWEVAAINGVFMDILGHTPSLTRPPYGNVSNEARIYINQPLILWTVDPEDWKYKDAAAVRSKVVGGSFDGAIILMHDIYATTVDAVPGIIDDLKAAGYEFMTISELAAARGVQMQNGMAYGSFRP